MKTAVIMNGSDHQYHEWEDGEIGYIDGYVQGGGDRPFLAVVIGERVVLCQTHQVKATGFYVTGRVSKYLQQKDNYGGLP